MRDLQDTEILFGAAHDLQSDRKTFRRETCRDRNRWIAGGRNIPAGLHPIDVVRKLYARDRVGIRGLDIERRRLGCGQNEIFVLFKERLKAAPKLAARG